MSIMAERNVQHAIREALGLEPGLVLWRNQVGQYTEDRAGKKRVIRYGLCPGSSDLVGLLDGRFVGIEVKAPGEKPTPDQERWLQLVRNVGGFACVAHSTDEARAALVRARAGGNQ